MVTAKSTMKTKLSSATRCPILLMASANTFSWKGFDLTIFFSGSYGNDVINYNRRFIEDVRSTVICFTSAANYAQLGVIDKNLPADDFRNLYVTNASVTHLPRLSASSTNANNRMSDLYIEDGSYLRLQNISLSYTLPKNIVRKIKLENVKVYMNLQNVYTWTKYDGFDPEVGAMYGDALMTGPRLWSLSFTSYLHLRIKCVILIIKLYETK